MMKTRSERVHLTDEDLLQRIKAGEAALFAILMKRYNQKFFRIARGMGIPDEDCDDIIQQTYIQIYLKLQQFRGESSASTWMTRVLINQCLMFRRKQRPVVSGDGELEGFETIMQPQMELPSTPETEMISRELQLLVERSIEDLPEDYRVVFVMRQIEDMSVKEIASALSLSEANVKVRMHRARKLLEQRLQSYFEPKELYKFGNARCDRIVQDVLTTIQAVL